MSPRIPAGDNGSRTSSDSDSQENASDGESTDQSRERRRRLEEEVTNQEPDAPTTQRTRSLIGRRDTGGSSDDPSSSTPDDLNAGRRDTGGSSDDTSSSTPDDLNAGRRSSGSSSDDTSSSTPDDLNAGRRDTGGSSDDTSSSAPDGRRIPDDASRANGQSGEQQSADSNTDVEVVDSSTTAQGAEQFGEGEVQSQASELESQVIENNDAITDESQVRVVKEGDTLRAELTTQGKEAAEQAAASARVAGLQGGRRQIQERSIETAVADRAGNAVSANEVDVDLGAGGINDVSVSESVPQVAPQVGGQRELQQQAIENDVAARAGNAVSSGEVSVDLSGSGLDSVAVRENVPVVANRAGGRRSIQGESIEQEIADGVEGLSEREVAANLTSSGANPGLTAAATRVRIEEQLAQNSERFGEGDFDVTVSQDGDVSADVTTDARRDALRERAQEQNPNAESIEIVQEGGELYAEIEEANNIDRARRLAGNFADDPVGSVTEGGSDIVDDLASDTGEFVAGRVRGIQNPGETLDYAVSGVEENTIDPTVEGIDDAIAGAENFASDPVGESQLLVEDAAEVVANTATGASEFNADLIGGAIDIGENQVRNLQAGTTGALAAGAVPVAAAEPTPIGEGVLLAAGGTVVLGGAAYKAGQRAGEAFEESSETTLQAGEVDVEEPDTTEIPTPSEPSNFRESEIDVDESTTRVENEIEIPQGRALEQGEIDAPESPPDSGVSINNGEVEIPTEFSGQLTGSQQRDGLEGEQEDRLEDLLASEDELSRRESEELNELARQAQEQTLFEQQRRYGDQVRDRVPEFRDGPLSEGEAQNDIGSGIAGEAREPEVVEDADLIGGSTEGIQRDETLPVQENFERFLREELNDEQYQRREPLLERAQEQQVTSEDDVTLPDVEGDTTTRTAPTPTPAEFSPLAGDELERLDGLQEELELAAAEDLTAPQVENRAAEAPIQDATPRVEPERTPGAQGTQPEFVDDVSVDLQEELADPELFRSPTRTDASNELVEDTTNNTRTPRATQQLFSSSESSRRRARFPLGFDSESSRNSNPFGGDEQRFDFGDVDLL